MKPTEPGWYWHKGFFTRPEGEPVEVIIRPGHEYLCIYDPECCQHTKRNFIAVAKMGGEWGPKLDNPFGGSDEKFRSSM